MAGKKRPQPIRQSNIQIPPPVRFLLERVMRELLVTGIITPSSGRDAPIVHVVKLEELRIVIGKGMAIAHRIGGGAARPGTGGRL